MATLTSEWQYLGRSSVMKSVGGTLNYYVLLFAKAVPNNTTGFYTVTINERLASTNTNARFYQYPCSYSGTIAGQTAFSGTNKPWAEWEIGAFSQGGVSYMLGTTTAEGTVSVDCTDGKPKDITLSCTWSMGSQTASYTPTANASRTVSVTATLAAIPRGSVLDNVAGGSYFNETITYKYTPQNANYYNRCNISVKLSDGYVAVKSLLLGKKSTSQQTGTVTFSASELSTIYEQLPDTTKGTIRFTLRTYTDSNYTDEIGNTSYKDIVLSIPTAVKPSASLAVTMVNSNSWIAGKGIYVAGFSSATLKLTASPGEGATLTTTNISGDGFSSNTSSVSVNLAGPGRFTFTGKATDSRGRYATNSKTITVLDYSNPTITALSVERGTYSSGWTAGETGPDIKVTFKIMLSLSDQGNVYGAKFTIDDKNVSPSAGTISGLASGANAVVYFKSVDGETGHKLRLTVTDSVGSSSSVTIAIPTIHITAEFNVSGKGFALGKTSEKDAFECAMDAEFSGSVKLIRADGSEVVFSDTGWIDMGTSDVVSIADATDTGRNGKGCFYRVINDNHVYVAFNVAFTYNDAAIVVNANAIPAKYRPKRKAYSMSLISGRAFARVGVNAAGNAIIDWVQEITASDDTTSASTNWIDGYVDYWI